MANVPLKEKTARLALVGGETLLGRELQEVLESRTGAKISAYGSSAEGSFGEQEGEAVYLEPLNAQSTRDDVAILIAGSRDGAMKAYDIAKSAGGHPVVIDCTGHLENQSEARLIAPLLLDPSGVENWLLVIAHPAASAGAIVLNRLARHRRIRRSILHIFEPASERGKRGITELHQQTTSLLSFKPLDKEVFDAQVSFNLLSQYGEEATAKLSGIEERIERNLAMMLERESGRGGAPMPSLRVVQAPIFHGYSISAWVEFEEDITAEELGEALASAQIEVRGPLDTAPDAVGAAGQSGLIAGDIRIDRNNARAAWFWVVADNLRLTADAAAEIVGSLVRDRQ
ncbi:MAG: hypothetical protein JO091_04570 [Acidobacteriaceae bacterium]|nr:hypothetical protein [Acidobacteriaceae bacterium]